MDPASPARPHLRPLTAADIPTCARLYRRAYEQLDDGGAPDEIIAAAIVRDVLRLFPDQCFAAERGGELQGFILCSSFAGLRATVEELVVAPEHQGTGVGSALLDHVMDLYRRRGVSAIELAANRHAPAYAFYRKRGFIENETHRLMGRAL